MKSPLVLWRKRDDGNFSNNNINKRTKVYNLLLPCCVWIQGLREWVEPFFAFWNSTEFLPLSVGSKTVFIVCADGRPWWCSSRALSSSAELHKKALTEGKCPCHMEISAWSTKMAPLGHLLGSKRLWLLETRTRPISVSNPNASKRSMLELTLTRMERWVQTQNIICLY